MVPGDPQLYGLNGQVHWPAFAMRAALRGLILWPVFRYVGGCTGARAIAASAAGGALLTGIDLAWDTTGSLLQAAAPTTLPGMDGPQAIPTPGGFHQAPDAPYIDVPFTYT